MLIIGTLYFLRHFLGQLIDTDKTLELTYKIICIKLSAKYTIDTIRIDKIPNNEIAPNLPLKNHQPLQLVN